MKQAARIMALVTLAAFLAGLAACPEIGEAIYQEKLDAWRAAHPGEAVTPEVEAELRLEARKEAAEYEKKLGKDAGTAITGFASGNVILGLLGVFGLAATGAGIYSKVKKAKKKGGAA